MSAELKTKVELILGLLEQIATKEVVVNFLKGKKLAFSGSWAELVEKRVYPAVVDNKVTTSELISLLASSEEYGRQHIFLYKLKTEVVACLGKSFLMPKLVELGLDSLTVEPKILDQPDEPTISDIRWDGSSFIVKMISKRSKLEAVDEVKDAEGYFIKRYKEVSSRVTSIFKAHDSGLIEVRISSKHNSNQYYDEVLAFLDMLKDFIPVLEIKVSAVSLYTSKTNIWSKRDILSDTIRFSDATLKNPLGYSLKAATPTRDFDLMEDQGVNSSMANFQSSGVYCYTNNIFFKALETRALPSKEVHVLMSGEANEFAVTAFCNSEDYNYVLKKILEFNE